MDELFNHVLPGITGLKSDLTTVLLMLLTVGLVLLGFYIIKQALDIHIWDSYRQSAIKLKGGEFANESDADDVQADIDKIKYKQNIKFLSGCEK